MKRLPAQRVYSREFDPVFFDLPLTVRGQVMKIIRELGEGLDRFPHERLEGLRGFRIRAGDHRVIYDFDVARNILFLGSLGHRSKIYKDR